jgi:hypothetical protein
VFFYIKERQMEIPVAIFLSMQKGILGGCTDTDKGDWEGMVDTEFGPILRI